MKDAGTSTRSLATAPPPRVGRRQAYQDARHDLLAAQKTGRGVPAYTRYVNRAMGRHLAALASVARLTPNQVTALSMLASATAMTLMCTLSPSGGVGLSVGLLMVLGYALDAADGQLARLQHRAGPSGEWLDHVSDQARQTALHCAVMVYLFRFLPELPRAVILVPMVYLVAVNTRFLSQILADQLRRAGAVPVTPESDDRRVNRRALLQLPSDPGVLCVTCVLTAIPIAFWVAYAALAAANVALTVASLLRRRAELSAAS